MAKRSRKTVDVQKFGGVEELGSIREEGLIDGFKSELSGNTSVHKDVPWDLQSLEVESKTKLEDDEGHGTATVIRMFEFRANPIAFASYQPSFQELFNTHYKGIETALWKDGLKVRDDVNPRIVVDQAQDTYKIFVGASPARGHLLNERPKTLQEIAHG